MYYSILVEKTDHRNLDKEPKKKYINNPDLHNSITKNRGEKKLRRTEEKFFCNKLLYQRENQDQRRKP